MTRFASRQIQPFSNVFNCFKFNSTTVTNVQFTLFNFKAFSKNSTIFNHFATKSRIPTTSSVIESLHLTMHFSAFYRIVSFLVRISRWYDVQYYLIECMRGSSSHKLRSYHRLVFLSEGHPFWSDENDHAN